MRPWLFEGNACHETAGRLLQTAAVLLLGDEGAGAGPQRQALQLCTTFCEAGTLVLSSFVRLSQGPFSLSC